MAKSRPARREKTAAASLPSNNDCGALLPLRTGNYELGWDAAAERLVISIDCRREVLAGARASHSGKRRIVASTAGFAAIPVPGVAGLQLSLTATLPNDAGTS